MKVLHILNDLNPSGAEVMLRVAAPFWKSHGLDLHVLSTGNSIGPYSGNLADAGYKLHHIRFSKSLSFLLALSRLMKTENFDVVHIHTERANLAYGLTSRIMGVPKIVRTIHSVFRFHGLLRFERSLQRRLLTAIGVTHLSVSRAVLECEQKLYRNPTTLIDNWYDSDRFRPPTSDEKMEARKSLGVSQSCKIIVSVGNCSVVKNHSALIESLALLEDRDILYLHVGREDDRTSERLLSEKLGLADRIRFLGHLADPRVALWAADVFVMPSLYEGAGIAAIEALATGLPCVLSTADGLKSILGDDGSIIYSQPDCGAVSRAIAQSLSLHRSIGAAARARTAERIKGRYSKERGAAAYLATYYGKSSQGTAR
jgi:glycosyltransferase involved in cell wall biosynthesis